MATRSFTHLHNLIIRPSGKRLGVDAVFCGRLGRGEPSLLHFISSVLHVPPDTTLMPGGTILGGGD